MRIVKPGKLGSLIPKLYGTCKACGCEVECEKSEVTYEDRPCGRPYIVCPTDICNTRIYLRLTPNPVS